MRSKWIDGVATGLALCLSAANPASAQQDFQWRGISRSGRPSKSKGSTATFVPPHRHQARSRWRQHDRHAAATRTTFALKSCNTPGASPSAPSIQHLPAATRIGASRETVVDSTTRTTTRSCISTYAFLTALGSSGGP